MLSAMPMNEPDVEERSAAILDVDGALHPSDVPLGVGFSGYILAESADEALGYRPDVPLDPDYFESDEWQEIRQDVETHREEQDDGRYDTFRPHALEDMYGHWHAMTTGEEAYQEGAMAITTTWVQGVGGMEKDRVETLADEYIAQIEGDIPRPVNNILGTLQGPTGSHNVFLVSLNPQEVLEPYAEVIFGGEYGRDQVYGTVVATDEDGRYVTDSEPEREMVTGEGKGNAIDDIAGRQDTAFDAHSLAVGDTYADMPLFKHTQHAALVNARNGLNQDVLTETLTDGGEPQVFNVKGIDGLVRRLAGGGEPGPQIIEVDGIQTFWDRLREDDTLQEALGLR